jgi:hypothetical protein
LLFDEARVKDGQIEVRQKDLADLKLSGDVLKPAGEWNLVEIFSLGEQAVYQVNGRVVCAVANLRYVKPDGKNADLWGGSISLGSGTGKAFFRRIELRPILGLPLDFPDSP